MSDLISRQAAIRIASGYCHFTNVAKELEKLPSVQPVDKDINVSCKDAISRQGVIDICNNVIDLWQGQLGEGALVAIKNAINNLPSVQPTYTEAQLQKMQDMEQSEIEKAFALGQEDARAEIIHCGDCIHADYARKDVLGRIYCLNHGFYWDALAYCSYAERRTNETD